MPYIGKHRSRSREAGRARSRLLVSGATGVGVPTLLVAAVFAGGTGAGADDADDSRPASTVEKDAAAEQAAGDSAGLVATPDPADTGLVPLSNVGQADDDEATPTTRTTRTVRTAASRPSQAKATPTTKAPEAKPSESKKPEEKPSPKDPEPTTEASEPTTEPSATP